MHPYKMKNLLPFILLFCSLLANGQVAIIKDKDGFTNVRKKPDGQSEIIHKIYENEVFWFDYEKGVDTFEWVPVNIPKNDFSLGISEPEYIFGFIHISRLQPLDELKPYEGSDFSFEYVIQPFDSTNRIIDRREGSRVAAVDDRPSWGTDGGFPKTQVKTINITIEGKKLNLNRVFYLDIYECTNSFKIYKNGDSYIVYQWNSDGAGYYEIAWVFTKKGLQQRLVGTMI